MTSEEYKESYSEETLIELEDTIQKLLTLYKRIGDVSKISGAENDIKAIRDAIKQKKVESLSVELGDDEKSLIEAFKTTALGREGLLNDAFFSGGGRKALNSLIIRGVVHEIEHFTSYSYLPNHTHFGLVGEDYPTTQEEWYGFRDTGYSNKMSFRDYLTALNAEEIEWTSEKITEFINKEIDAEFKKKFKTDTYWLNFITFDGIARLKELVSEGGVAEGGVAEDIFRRILIEKGAFDKFNSDNYNVEILDVDWFQAIISDSIDHLKGKL